MNLTVSQWLQLAAIAASAVISISRWVWDAKKDKRTINDIQTANDAVERQSRPKVPLSSWFGFFTPILIIIYQMLTPGAMTRFDLGLMLLSSIVFLGFISLSIARSLNVILRSHTELINLYMEHSKLLGELISNDTERLKVFRTQLRKLCRKSKSDDG